MTNQEALQLDQDGHLVNESLWNEHVAQILANSLTITLTEEHCMILKTIRQFYDIFEHAPNSRPLIKYLTKELPHLPINNAYLQKIFKTGLVARDLSRLAGLPKPSNCL